MSCVARVIALMPVIIAPLRFEPLIRHDAPDERGRSYTWKASAGRRGVAVLDAGGLRQACAAVATLGCPLAGQPPL